MNRRLGTALPLADLTEAEWAAQIVGLAKTLGWRRYHTYRSDRSTPGWPDEAFVRERLILAELKRETTKPTDAQTDWLTALAAAGAEVYLWRPSDLDEIAQILASRGHFTLYDVGTLHHHRSDATWTPASLWTPDGCRHDQRETESA